eukprot:14257276-Alexandrium_andersonii.AAC.1
MSASLVGSEMCIRDRDTQEDAARRRVANANPNAVETVPAATMRRQASPCLLYTSDAADDM